MHSSSSLLKKSLISLGIITSIFSQSALAASSQIGTGTVVGSSALTTPVIWNGNFPGTATSTINGIVVKAQILPTLNMVVSTGVLNLWTLSSTTYSTGTLSIEIGTNAVNGASITAKSSKWGLQNLSNSTTYINSLATDGAADSYRFSSTIYAAKDSTVTGFTQTANLNTEINSTAIQTIYTSNKPQALSTGVTNDDLKFSVSAKPNAQTPAGNYQDVVVLTVTGNF